MNYTEKVIRQSNYWYNDGLKRANFRDLSGAIASLRRSLQYYRKNIAARNLLGLVYYGRGEINEALVEWIISKNLKPRDNIANYFIKKVQNSPRDLNRLNTNIKKYNQCLQYCQQDAEDLALIQIKKIVAAHPTYVKGYQLLALLSIRKEQYARASQALKRAHKLDTTDGITLYYMNELSELRAQGRRTSEDRSRSVSYREGNETIIQPTLPTLKAETGATTIINIVIGIVIGVAVMAFLIQPAIDENEAMVNADAIREYAEQMNAKTAEINALTTELETYRTTNDEAEVVIAQASLTQSNYEALIEVQMDLNGGTASTTSMKDTLLEVDESLLGEVGLEWYEELAEEVFEPLCEDLYQDALAVYNQVSITAYADGTPLEHEPEEYEPIVTALEEVMEMDSAYEDYTAMLMLAEAYEGMEDWVNAQTYYNRIISESTNSARIADATDALVDVDKQVELME